MAAGAADLDAAVVVRYRLGAGNWVFTVIMLVFLASFTLAAATLLRHPGVVCQRRLHPVGRPIH